jgi:hypothetical protein
MRWGGRLVWRRHRVLQLRPDDLPEDGNALRGVLNALLIEAGVIVGIIVLVALLRWLF